MKFRSKPVVNAKPVMIEAEQYLPSQKKIPEGVKGIKCGLCGFVIVYPHVHAAHSLWHIVSVTEGDWIVAEPDAPGRFYPINPNIFAAKYEAVE